MTRPLSRVDLRGTIVKPGDLVKVHPDGTSVFAIVSIEEDGRAIIESAVDRPGKYPWSVSLSELVPADA